MERQDSVTDGGQVISFSGRIFQMVCAETNCDSMQNGSITLMFINKEDFSFPDALCSLKLRDMWFLL